MKFTGRDIFSKTIQYGVHYLRCTGCVALVPKIQQVENDACHTQYPRMPSTKLSLYHTDTQRRNADFQQTISNKCWQLLAATVLFVCRQNHANCCYIYGQNLVEQAIYVSQETRSADTYKGRSEVVGSSLRLK